MKPRMLRALLLFVALVVLGAWPLTSIRTASSEALCVLLGPLLGELQFGQGGHAHLRPAQVANVRRPGEHVSSDALLILSVAGTTQTLPVGLNLRRDFYLPLWIFLAATATAPVSLVRRAAVLVLGLPVALYLCVGSLYLTICWLFAHEAPAVYPLSTQQLQWLDGLVGSLLMPPALRFFAPIVLAAVMLGSLRRPLARTSAQTRASTVTGAL